MSCSRSSGRWSRDWKRSSPGLDGRLEPDAHVLARDFLQQNELGLASETIADALSDAATPLTDQERAEMLALVERMAMDDSVSRALILCPRSA